jgi:biotin synthase
MRQGAGSSWSNRLIAAKAVTRSIKILIRCILCGRILDIASGFVKMGVVNLSWLFGLTAFLARLRCRYSTSTLVQNDQWNAFMNASFAPTIRHDWTRPEITALFALPFSDLMFQAQSVHRAHFNPNEVQVSTLCSIKTGACPEDCAYCPQSARYDTGLEREKLMAVEKVIEEAKAAKASGATRFCMGAAWRSPKNKDMPYVTTMVQGVKALGLETCMTLGMLDESQAQELADAGLDYYNHNLDTSPEYYGEIITTRTYQDRLATLDNVRKAGMKVCCGGIVGMGEEESDRAGLLQQLANMPEHPESVPINMLVKVGGTPLENEADLDPFDFLRTIAVARILMPQSHVRLSAGREQMNEQTQAMAFLAGANSIFYGEKLLTTPNPEANKDMQLFKKLGIKPEAYEVHEDESEQEASIVHQLQEAAMDSMFYNAAK